jgi:hypothetical protein
MPKNLANLRKKKWQRLDLNQRPRELLDHASSHLTEGKDFDFRISMISIDNAVELAIKTYLGLPKRIRVYEGPTRTRIASGERLQKFSISQILMENFWFDTIPLRDLVEIIQTVYVLTPDGVYSK